MSYAQTVRRMSDDELLEEYDWTSRERCVSDHEAYRNEWAMERMHAELMRRGIQWS